MYPRKILNHRNHIMDVTIPDFFLVSPAKTLKVQYCGS